jgi:hypothetical protein
MGRADAVNASGDARHMSSTFAIVLAAKLVGSVLAVNDASLPQFNPATGCKAALAINQSIDLIESQTYEDCIADEKERQAEIAEELVKVLGGRQKTLRRANRGWRYAELRRAGCILVTINVENPSSVPPQ